MGLISKAFGVGVGYVLAQPEVRRKLVELVRHPAVKQGRDQVQELATNGLRTAQRQLGRAGVLDTTDPHGAASTPRHAGVGTPSPSPRVSDPTALREGVLPPAEDPGAPATPRDS